MSSTFGDPCRAVLAVNEVTVDDEGPGARCCRPIVCRTCEHCADHCIEATGCDGRVDCPTCGSSGKLESGLRYSDVGGWTATLVDCGTCAGRGWVPAALVVDL